MQDSYWPTNGIQKTPYKTWLKQAEEAGYNVVHVPLSAKSRKLFNTTAAIDFFQSVEGLEYGYINMLWGWLVFVGRDILFCPSNSFRWGQDRHPIRQLSVRS